LKLGRQASGREEGSALQFLSNSISNQGFG